MRLLRSFLAVAEELHFARAATRLFVSQPALSQQIRKLERDLGVALFTRDRRRVALTPAGAALLPEAHAATVAADAYLAAARRISRAHAGVLTIGFHVQWPDQLLPRILRAFRRDRPGVDARLKQFDFTDLTAGLRTGATDAAFLAPPFDDTGLHLEPLCTELRALLLPEDHPLAGRSSLTVTELLALPGPWAEPPSSDPTWRDHWTAAPERAARPDAPPLGTTIQVATFEEYQSLVASGAAIGLGLASTVSDYPWPGVAVVPVVDLAPTTLALGWRRGDARPLVAAFAATARREVVAASLTDPGRSGTEVS